MELQNNNERRKALKEFEDKQLAPQLIQKLRQRNYRLPKQYISWNELSVLLAIAIAIETSKRTGVPAESHTPGWLCNFILSMWALADAPLYCLTPEIVEAFDQTNATEKKGVMADFNPPLPVFLITVPKGLVTYPNEYVGDENVDFIVVHCMDKKSCQLLGIYDKPGLDIQWGTICDKETAWFSSTIVNSDGTLFYRNSFDGINLTEKDSDFIERVRNIVINVLLALTYTPELFSEMNYQDKINIAPKRGFTPIKEKEEVRYPLWIGKNYSTPRNSTRSNGSSGTHRSPRLHLRRGHWRKYKGGENSRWAEDKVIWIKPCFIGYSNT